MKQPTRRRTPHRRPRRYPLLPGSILLLLVVVVLVYQNVQLFSDSRGLELPTADRQRNQSLAHGLRHVGATACGDNNGAINRGA
jgi:hypothetical protein